MTLLAKASEHATLVLRLGLSAVILWFGANQLLWPDVWIVWVPDWAGSIVTPATIVLLNGAFEVVSGVFLIVGLFVPWVALLLSLHLLVLVFEIGLTAVGVRDFGLAAAFLALAMYTYKPVVENAHE